MNDVYTVRLLGMRKNIFVYSEFMNAPGPSLIQTPFIRRTIITSHAVVTLRMELKFAPVRHYTILATDGDVK
jgi:hypothetical protein